MRRRFLDMLAMMAALACAACIALWILGSRRAPGVRGVYYSGASGYVQLSTHRHILSLTLASGSSWPALCAANFSIAT